MSSRSQYKHPFLQNLHEAELQALAERCREWGMHPAEFAKLVSNWFKNFREDADHPLALKLLHAIEYYSEAAFHELLVDRQAEVTRYLLDNNLDPKRIWFALPSDLADSAARHAHPLSKVWSLPNARFVSFEQIGAMLGGKLGAQDTLVLFNDNYGSGKQFMREVWPQVQPLVGKVGAVLIVGAAIAAEALALFMRTAHGVQILPDHATASVRQIKGFTSADVDRLIELGRRVYPNHPLGFGQCGLLLAFHFQCPNTSLPLIWADGKNNALGEREYPWNALFPYRGKIRVARVSGAVGVSWNAVESIVSPAVAVPSFGLLNSLQLLDVGPAASMSLTPSSRLNLITGDNGLGKSFLLDIVWWALTAKWPAEVNKSLLTGKKALPRSESASIDFALQAKEGKEFWHGSTFSWQQQAWSRENAPLPNPGLVLYAMSDGSFAAWDPARNAALPQFPPSSAFNAYTLKQQPAPYLQAAQAQPNLQTSLERPLAYVLNPNQVWDGLPGSKGEWTCNGLIRDWASWQRENGRAFQSLCRVLKALSPSEHEIMQPGALTRISLNDVRDMPTIKMPYGDEVPVVHASSGMRRIISLAYFLVWCWEEHMRAAEMTREPHCEQMVYLIDEVEAHLHPKWQRKIVPALMNVMQLIDAKVQVQAIMVTHSPLVMASLEPWFDPKTDAWFDLDFHEDTRQVVLEKRPFVRRGDAANWLMSPAFDMPSARSEEAEQALENAAKAMSDPHFTAAQAQALREQLRKVLGDTDPFWLRLNFVGQQKGWWA